MKYESLWLQDKQKRKTIKLNKNIGVDVLIIGGGITGLQTAYFLKDSNQKVCLVDSNLIGHGITSKTTAKINYLQETIYQDITKKYSLKIAKWYLDSQKDSIQKIKDIIKTEKIDCDLKKVTSYLIASTNKDVNKVTSYLIASTNKDVNKVKKEEDILTKLKIDVQRYSGNIDGINSKYAISVDDTYVFHPLKYLYFIKDICLKNNISIYENTKVLKIKKDKNNYLCLTDEYYIKAKKVVIACHYPFFFLPLKDHIEKSYITSFPSINKNRTLITSSKTKSIRYYQDNKIYLSSSCNLCCKLNDKKNFDKVIKKNSEYVWKNDDLITVDKIPYIGKLKKNNDSLLIGTGYNTWGMTNGTLAGMILSDMILGRENKYKYLCNPLRVNNIINLGSFLYNMGSNIKGYIQSKLFKNKKWYSSKVIIKKINGESIGIYKDKNKEYMVYNKCPHMGCSLIFNEEEKTWDCPCHASRFDINDKCIKGPSKYDITYKKDW